MQLTRNFLIGAVVMFGLIQSMAAATPIFYAVDPGMGPGDPIPNSVAEAAAFDGAAGWLAPIQLIDFEGPVTLTPSGFVVADGVSIIRSHTETGSAADGISTLNSVTTGYNTTVGGQTHLGMVPLLDGSTASVTFDFDEPIQAFGAFLTGVQTAMGELHVLFDDGSPQDYLISGDPAGGALFFGFILPETVISSLTFEMRGTVVNSRDFIGIDDVRYVGSVPEPATLAMLGIGGLLLRKRK